MATASKELARDLEADLAICTAATPGPWMLAAQYELLLDAAGHALGFIEAKEDRIFAMEARQGWPYAIRRAMEAEREIDRLRNELQMYQEQDRGARGCCPDDPSSC